VDSFRRGDMVFDVRDGGPPDGEPVVLLHGFPQDCTAFDRMAPALHAAGLRTLALDQRGYSPGARPRGAEHYRMTRLVGDVVALIQRYGAPVHLAGHDWGAAVAWTTASARPDLVRTLTAVSVPHPAAFARALRSGDQARRSSYMLVFRVPGLAESIVRLVPGAVRRLLGRSGLSDAEVRRFQREIVEDGALPTALAWYRTWGLRRRRRTRPASGPRRVRVPTTLVWSDGDVALGRRGVDLTAEYVAAPYRLCVLEGVSHWIPTQAPEALAEAILSRIRDSGD
jgi:pimeloyl-ACP methyl ester carboxylesterase